MTIHNFSNDLSILNNFISEIRDANIQKDMMRFRRNIERIGEILSYELSKTLNYTNKDIQTPLGIKTMNLPTNEIVLCSILRAGLPLHNGIMNYLDGTESAFISAYRKHIDETNFEIKVEYFASPALENKTLILADPMLATGQSLVATYEAILKNGTPKETHIVAVIGAQEGVDFIQNHFPENTHLWIATIDDTLNNKGYIVPGLGDAGDLCFGPKL